ncbi:MAG: hypothetical protein FJ335_12340 [Sphingomonadales bacterium]|nr:hypothetical protein [Sphingomonadales bacterium]
MADLSLAFLNAEIGVADLVVDAGSLATDDGLRSAIVMSLFSDARAGGDDELPVDADPRGWWGDVVPSADRDELGSKLWLLDRAKVIPRVLASARDYATAALAWLVDDGVASSVGVDASGDSVNGELRLHVTVDRPTSGQPRRYDFVWGQAR